MYKCYILSLTSLFCLRVKKKKCLKLLQKSVKAAKVKLFWVWVHFCTVRSTSSTYLFHLLDHGFSSQPTQLLVQFHLASLNPNLQKSWCIAFNSIMDKTVLFWIGLHTVNIQEWMQPYHIFPKRYTLLGI